MSDTKAILLVNFFGIGGQLLFWLWLFFFQLGKIDLPLALVGAVMVLFAIAYLSAMMVWNALTLRAHNRYEYASFHMRDAVLIAFLGVAGPGGLLLLMVW